MKVLAWIIGLPVGLFVLVFVVFFVRALLDPTVGQPTEADRRKCVEAMTSNIGTSTRNYSDKAAYERRVAEDCKGFDLSKLR